MYQILLIDDAAADNFLHARTLQKRFPGCTVHTAEHGERGLEILAERCAEGVDLILLDVNMPVMDAWAFLDHYDRLGPHERAKALLLMVSIALPAADRGRVQASDTITATITKPLDADAVAAHLAERPALS